MSNNYYNLCLRYRMLIEQQRFCFELELASKIAETYRQMEAIAYHG